MANFTTKCGLFSLPVPSKRGYLCGENFPPKLPSQEVEEVERSNDAEGRVVSGFLNRVIPGTPNTGTTFMVSGTHTIHIFFGIRDQMGVGLGNSMGPKGFFNRGQRWWE